MTPGDGWVEVCAVDDVESEDVIRVDVQGRPLAIYRSPEDTFHATDAICTHEHADLSLGLVWGDVIECPKHNGRFNYKTGAAKGAPVCIDLKTYPAKSEGGRVWIEI